VVDRTFEISAGLVASTSTPGKTPPEESLAVPAIWPSCARAVAGSMNRNAAMANISFATRITTILQFLEAVLPITQAGGPLKRLGRF
jgi:hypothetical protein